MRLLLVGLLLASAPALADPKPKPRAATKRPVAQQCSIVRTLGVWRLTDLEALKLARLEAQREVFEDDLQCWFSDAELSEYYRLDLVENLIAQPVRASTPKKTPVRPNRR